MGPDACNSRGSCISGACKCKPGWGGKACEKQECPNLCTIKAQGTCNTETFECTCKKGWTGDDCSKKACPEDCNGHGQCQSDGVCLCQNMWTGESCKFPTCPNSCSGHGMCIGDKCKCDPKFKGDDCS